jgi:hypothetical protein
MPDRSSECADLARINSTIGCFPDFFRFAFMGLAVQFTKAKHFLTGMSRMTAPDVSCYPADTEVPVTVTLNLPPDVGRAFEAEARARGLSLDEFLSDLIRDRAEETAGEPAVADSPGRVEWEDGVPVLRTGRPMSVSMVDETLDSVRRERERTFVGLEWAVEAFSG